MNRNHFKYFDIILGLFVAVLLISNITSTKIVTLFGSKLLTFDGGTILFPLSYIFGDILTEVYGYAKSRRVIWTGFFSLVMMSTIICIVGKLPASPDWHLQEAYESILMYTPRIAIASIIGFFIGEFVNSFVLSKMKLLTQGRWLWTRTVGSTLVGQLFDTACFVTIAFYGTLPIELVISVIISNYIFKTLFEIIVTPWTYIVVGFLKKHENEDHYDYGENYSIFKLS
jgi:uncharacterized integral membrane protein (TIGR00697 family)